MFKLYFYLVVFFDVVIDDNRLVEIKCFYLVKNKEVLEEIVFDFNYVNDILEFDNFYDYYY